MGAYYHFFLRVPQKHPRVPMTMLWLTLYDGANMLIKNSRDVEVESRVLGGCGGCSNGWVGRGWCWW